MPLFGILFIPEKISIGGSQVGSWPPGLWGIRRELPQ